MKGRSKAKTALFVLIPLMVIGGGVAGYLAFASAAGSTGLVPSGSGTSAASSVRAEFSVRITHQEQHTADFGWLAQMALKGQFWSASCYVFCAQGVTYTLDPTTLITNYGHDFEQCKVFGSAGTITCTAADVATVVAVSASSTTPAAADTYSSGPCSSSNLVTANGFTPVAGTVTAGTAGSTVTTTIKNTFTASGSESSLQTACLLTETTSGSNIIVYAEGQFGPDTLASGNTLAITWSIART